MTDDETLPPGLTPQERVAGAEQRTNARIAGLGQRGIAVDPMAPMYLRLLEVCETLFGPTSDDERAAFEERVHARIHAWLDANEQQAVQHSARATLLQGVPGVRQ